MFVSPARRAERRARRAWLNAAASGRCFFETEHAAQQLVAAILRRCQES